MSAERSNQKEILDRQIPVTLVSGVYFLIKDNEIIYVGESENIIYRIGQHLKAYDFDSYSYIKIDGNKDELRKNETAYIHDFKPSLNKAFPKHQHAVATAIQSRTKTIPTAPRSLMTVKQFNKKYPSFPIGGLRHLIFYAETNGFSRVIRRIGRRILIDEDDFFLWVDGEKKHTHTQNT